MGSVQVTGPITGPGVSLAEITIGFSVTSIVTIVAGVGFISLVSKVRIVPEGTPPSLLIICMLVLPTGTITTVTVFLLPYPIGIAGTFKSLKSLCLMRKVWLP